MVFTTIVGPFVHTRRVNDDDEHLAVTAGRAAAIANVTPRRLTAWERTGLVTPAVQHRFSARNEVRLYSLRELIELRVISLLSEQVSVPAIRSVVRYLRDIAFDVSEVRFATDGKDGKHVYFQLPDSTWSEGRAPAQILIPRVIPLQEIRQSVTEAARNRERQAGKIVKARKVRHSRPVLEGTRVPVAAVQRWLDSGATDERILAAYPDLEVADLDAVRNARAAAAS